MNIKVQRAREKNNNALSLAEAQKYPREIWWRIRVIYPVFRDQLYLKLDNSHP